MTIFQAKLGDAEILKYQGILEKGELVQLAVYSLLAFFIIIYDVVVTRNLYIKNQLKWIAGGLGLGVLPFSIFYIIPFFRNSLPSTSGQLSVLFQIFLPVTLAYSISRYRLMDFEVLVKKRSDSHNFIYSDCPGLFPGQLSNPAILRKQT